MDFSKLDIFRAIELRSRWLTERQKVIAENVANSSTPGYQPSDLKPLDFKSHLKALPPLQMSATQPGHLQATPVGNQTAFPSSKTHDFETQPNGNAVVLEEEMIKSTENQSDYDAMAQLYRKQLSLVKAAIGSH